MNFIKIIIFIIVINLLQFRTMEIQMRQMDMKLAINILNDYIKQKDIQLIRIQQQFAIDFITQKESDIYQWLINTSKQIVLEIQILYQGSRSFYQDFRIEFAFQFFNKCFTILDQIIKYLIQALMERINKSIDIKNSPPPLQNKITIVEAVNDPGIQTPEQANYKNRQEVKRAKRVISQNLQNIDYYLNSLAYQDNRAYEQYKSQCDKLLLQRQALQNIKPSGASKQIIQTANMIQNAISNSEKLFQQSYLLKYMEFKSFLTNIQEPEALTEVFKQEMHNNTKTKFIQLITKVIHRHSINEKINYQRHQISLGTQTEDSKAKMQQKWQNLLMAEKKTNEKLTLELQKLKKSIQNSAIDKMNEIEKRLKDEETKKKQLENKLTILQHLYNEKCYEVNKLNNKKFQSSKTDLMEKTSQHSTIMHTETQKKQKILSSSFCQTDVDFYYHYFEHNKITEMQTKIDQLEKIVNHKQYIIKQMQAIKTFRDRFKSKQEICNVVIQNKKITSIAKSLHYLHEEEDQVEIFDQNESNKQKNSVEAQSMKKQVTFQNFKQKQLTSEKSVAIRKKGHSKTKIKTKEKSEKYRPYFTFNSQIQKFDSEKQFISCKSDFEQPHQISLKSILKGGNSQFKIDKSIQTEPMKKDQVIQSSVSISNQNIRAFDSKLLKEKSSLRDLSGPKPRMIRQSETSTLRSQKQKSYPTPSNFVEVKRSNFAWNENLQRQSKNTFFNNLPIVNRKSQNFTPNLKKNVISKSKHMLKINKLNQNKPVPRESKQVLHVNNSLNFNFNFANEVFRKQTARQQSKMSRVNSKFQQNRSKKLQKILITS